MSSGYFWRLKVTRGGKSYDLPQENLQSRIELFIPDSEEPPVFTVGSGDNDDLRMPQQALRHLVYTFAKNAVELKANESLKIKSKEHDRELAAGEMVTLAVAPNSVHSVTFPSGEVIQAKLSLETEKLPQACREYLESRYGPIRKIQEGASSLIYEIGGDKILKVLRPSFSVNGDVIKRFRKAAEKFQKIDSPYFNKIYEVQEKEDLLLYYVVMDQFYGDNFNNYLSCRGPLADDKAREIMQEINESLIVMDTYELSCRNLAPANILINRDGKIRLTGFFLIKSMKVDLTLPGARMVIPGYSSPEQISDPSKANIMTDVFSLGAIYYQMIAGETPIVAVNSTDYEVKMKSCPGFPATTIQGKIPMLPAESATLMSEMLSFDKDQRPTPVALMKKLDPNFSQEKYERSKAENKGKLVDLDDDEGSTNDEDFRLHPSVANEFPEEAAPSSGGAGGGIFIAAVLLVGLFLAAIFSFGLGSGVKGVEYSANLPEDTKGVIVVSSINNLIEDLKSESTLAQQVEGFSIQFLGANVLDATFFQSRGIRTSAPLGLAMVGDDPAQMRGLAFIPITSESDFSGFLEDRSKFPMPLQKKQIAGMECLVDNDQRPNMILTMQSNYCLLYGSQRDAVKLFEQDMVDSSDSFASNTNFQTAMKGLGNQGDGYLFIDGKLSQTVSDLTGQMQRGQLPPQASAVLEKTKELQEAILGYAISSELKSKSFAINAFTAIDGDSELAELYKTAPLGDTVKFWEQLVGDSYCYVYGNNDISSSWAQIEKWINIALKTTPDLPARDLDGLFKFMNEQSGLEIDWKNDLILNSRGQFLFSLGDARKISGNMTLDMFYAMSLNDEEALAGVLEQGFAKIATMGQDIASVQSYGDVKAYTFPVAIPPEAGWHFSPTLGIVNGCFFVTSSSDLFQKIVDGTMNPGKLEVNEKTMLMAHLDFQDAMAQVILASKSVDPSIEKQMDSMKFLAALDTIQSVAEVRSGGMHQSFELKTKQNIVSMITEGIQQAQALFPSRPGAPRVRPSNPVLQSKVVDGLKLDLATVAARESYRFFVSADPAMMSKHGRNIQVKVNNEKASYSSQSGKLTVKHRTQNGLFGPAELRVSMLPEVTKEKALLKIPMDLPPVNKLNKINKKANSGRYNVTIDHIGIFQNQSVVNFSSGKVFHEVPYGNEKLYVTEDLSGNGWSYFLLTGSVNAVGFEEAKNNFFAFDPDKKFFGGKLNVFTKTSVVGNTTHFALYGSLFTDKPKKVEFGYFPMEFFEKNKKEVVFSGIPTTNLPSIVTFPEGEPMMVKEIEGTKIALQSVGKVVRYSLTFTLASQEKYDYTVEAKGFKSLGSSSFSMMGVQNLSVNLESESGAPDQMDCTITLTSKETGKKVVYNFSNIDLTK